MLGVAGDDAISGYAQRTNLPAYTRNMILIYDNTSKAIVGISTY